MTNTEYTSIRVKVATKAQAGQAKKPKETWDDFILRCSQEPAIVMSESDIQTIVDNRISQIVVEEAQR